MVHQPLKKHLHSDRCNFIIEGLMKCREEHPIRKFTGICFDIERWVDQCLRDERIAKQKHVQTFGKRAPFSNDSFQFPDDPKQFSSKTEPSPSS